MKLLLINGPPRSGKDTVGEIVRELCGATVVKFAAVLKNMTHALYGLVDGDGRPLPHGAFEEVKDEPNEAFMGLTPRRAYIEVSERYMKPVHGIDIYGKLLAQSITGERGVVVVTDSGFVEEALRLAIETMPGEMLIFQIKRPGRTFKGDSRGWVRDVGEDQFYRITNDGSIPDLQRKVAAILDQRGWTS